MMDASHFWPVDGKAHHANHAFLQQVELSGFQGRLRPVAHLFHHAEREMGGSRCLLCADMFQVDR
jgi:hypothetical protein